MATSILFDLPEGLQVDILISWLDLKSLATLDIACISPTLRPSLLQLLRDKNFHYNATLFERILLSSRSNAHIHWLVRREIPAKEVILGRGLNSLTEHELLHNPCLSTVKTLFCASWNYHLKFPIYIQRWSMTLMTLILHEVNFHPATLMTFLAEHAPLLQSLKLNHVGLLDLQQAQSSNLSHSTPGNSIISSDPYRSSMPSSVRIYHGHDPLETLNLKAIKKLPYLQEIDIYVVNQGEEEMNVFFAFAPALKRFAFQDASSHLPVSHIISAVSRCCPLIETLSIRLSLLSHVNGEQDGKEYQDSEDIIEVLTRSCRHMRALDIPDLHYTDTVLSLMQSRGWNTQLEELIMFNSKSITNDGILSFISPNPSLSSRVLHLPSQSIDLPLSFAVKKLQLRDNELVNAETLISLIQSIGSTLTCLDLRGCYGVTGEVLSAITEYCPMVETLNLSRCFGLYCEEEWSHLCQMSSLTSLDIGESYSMTPRMLIELCRISTSLIHVDITECSEITSTAIQTILSISTKRMKLTAMGVQLKTITSSYHIR